MKLLKYTMIELLLTIAIIIILSAILLPALSRARGSVKRIVCTNNLKQIFLHSQNYSSDYNDLVLPGAVLYGAYNVWWRNMLMNQKYIVGSRKELFCPAFDSERSSKTVAGQETDYGENYHTNDPATTMHGWWPFKNSKVINPSYCVQFGEAAAVTFRPYYTTWESDMSFRHFNSSNFGMFDGHVENFRLYKIGIDNTGGASEYNGWFEDTKRWRPFE